jgi:hypothetical protein
MKHTLLLHPTNARNALLMQQARLEIEKQAVLLHGKSPKGQKPTMLRKDAVAVIKACMLVIKHASSLGCVTRMPKDSKPIKRKRRRHARKVSISVEVDG